MQLGISVQRLDAELLKGFDVVLVPIRQVTGRVKQIYPFVNARPVVSCFGHTMAAKRSELVAVSEDGLPALPGKHNLRDGFAWGWVCPNADEYRQELLAHLTKVATSEWSRLHLDSVQFPDANYCHCPRCRTKFAQSGMADWWDWRASVITEWVATVAERVGKPLSLTLHPDPYFLRERFGTDMEALAPFAEWFLVPLYCLTYDLTYWLDTLLYAFVRRSPRPVFVELYAVEPPARGLLKAMAAVAKFPVAGIIFYDPSAQRVRAVAQLLREDKEVRQLVAAHPNQTFRQLAERLAEWVKSVSEPESDKPTSLEAGG